MISLLPDWLKAERCRDQSTPENRGKSIEHCEVRAKQSWQNGKYEVTHWQCRRCNRIFHESGRITLRNKRKK